MKECLNGFDFSLLKEPLEKMKDFSGFLEDLYWYYFSVYRQQKHIKAILEEDLGDDIFDAVVKGKQPEKPSITQGESVVQTALIELVILEKKYERIKQRNYGKGEDLIQEYEKINLEGLAESEMNVEEGENILLHKHPIEFFHIYAQCEQVLKVLCQGVILHELERKIKEQNEDRAVDAQSDAPSHRYNININFSDIELQIDFASVFSGIDEDMCAFLTQMQRPEVVGKASQFYLAAMIEQYKKETREVIAKAKAENATAQKRILKAHVKKLDELQKEVLMIAPEDPERLRKIEEKAKKVIVAGDRLQRELEGTEYFNIVTRAFNRFLRNIASCFGLDVEGKLLKEDVKPLLQFSSKEKDPAEEIRQYLPKATQKFVPETEKVEKGLEKIRRSPRK